jgi:hypothetical protein
MTSIAAKVLIAPIRFYQRFITPYTPATCRYYPTCSAYAVTALRTRGAFVGTGLTIWRLLRCNPWSDGGIDHVPAKGERRARERDEPAGSSPTVCTAEHRTAGTDLDAPQTAAAEPMTGRSAA